MEFKAENVEPVIDNTGEDQDETRELLQRMVIQYVPNGRVLTTLVVNGKTLDLKVSNFIKSETADRHRIDNRLPSLLLYNAEQLAILYKIVYEKFNGNVIINSAYRCKRLNNIVSRSLTSQHMTCEALDLKGINGVKNKDIFDFIAENLQFNQLIWEYGTKDEPQWVHVGLGIKQEILRAVRVNGRTNYIPFSFKKEMTKIYDSADYFLNGSDDENVKALNVHNTYDINEDGV